MRAMSLLKRLYDQLYVQVLIGIVAGIALGIAAPRAAVQMKPLGDGFIALLRILLAPIIFCTVVHGLANIRDMRKLGRLGTKAIVYFEVVSTLGLAMGFALANLFKPGAGLHAGILAGNPALSAGIANASAAASRITVVNFLLCIIPTTIVDAFARGEILQVLFVSLLFGVALSLSLPRDSILLTGIAEAQRVLFRILGFIMRLAPVGAFGAMAAAVGANGGGTLLYLARVVILMYSGCLVFVLVVFGFVCFVAGISIFQVLRMIKDEIFIVFGTASSEVVFPRLVQKLEEAGCDEAVVGFVLPAGYSFNLDGTAMYLALAVGFIAQATDTPLSLGQQLAVLGVLMFTSKGGTTIAGSAYVKLAATLQSVRVLPLSGLGLMLGVDRLMSTALAVTNMIGNSVAVFALARWEDAFNRAKFDAYLAAQRNGATPAVQPHLPGAAPNVAARRPEIE
jgi:aerobic C4-dicarboxylate transport protein